VAPPRRRRGKVAGLGVAAGSLGAVLAAGGIAQASTGLLSGLLGGLLGPLTGTTTSTDADPVADILAAIDPSAFGTTTVAGISTPVVDDTVAANLFGTLAIDEDNLLNLVLPVGAYLDPLADEIATFLSPLGTVTSDLTQGLGTVLGGLGLGDLLGSSSGGGGTGLLSGLESDLGGLLGGLGLGSDTGTDMGSSTGGLLGGLGADLGNLLGGLGL
jgi:hypothetical protein